MTIGASATTFKLLASVALVGGAASVAALGTYGGFTSTTSANEAVATGRVELRAGSGPVRGLDVPATGLVPDDTVQRQLVLTRSSRSETFGSVTMTTSSRSQNLLTQDTTNGLQLEVDLCPSAWEKKSEDSNELTCAGTTTPLAATRAVLGDDLDLGPAVTAALNDETGVAHLRITLSLPETADNKFQGLSNRIGFEFVATQRAGEYR